MNHPQSIVNLETILIFLMISLVVYIIINVSEEVNMEHPDRMAEKLKNRPKSTHVPHISRLIPTPKKDGKEPF